MDREKVCCNMLQTRFNILKGEDVKCWTKKTARGLLPLEDVIGLILGGSKWDRNDLRSVPVSGPLLSEQRRSGRQPPSRRLIPPPTSAISILGSLFLFQYSLPMAVAFLNSYFFLGLSSSVNEERIYQFSSCFIRNARGAAGIWAHYERVRSICTVARLQ